MAGEWIKMRTGLRTHPKVVRVASALKVDRLRVIGAMFVTWSVFDEHSTDGNLVGYTPEVLDEEVGLPGFAQAMIAVSWLAEDMVEGLQTLVAPEFSSHNGQSSKKRITDTERKRGARAGGAGVRKVSDKKSDKSGTREEKRREEENTHSADGRGDAGAGGCAGEAGGVCVSAGIPNPEDTSPAAMAWRALQPCGDAVPGDLRVEALLQRGATVAQLSAAAQAAVGKGKGVAYALGTVSNQLGQAGQLAAGVVAAAAAWDSGRSGIEAMGDSLGLGRWDEAASQLGRGESFEAYLARVRRAVGERGAHAH